LYSTVLSNVVVNGDAYNVSSDANLGTAPTSLLTNQILLNGGGLASSGTVGMNTNRGISVTTNGGFITINSGSLIPWNLYSQNADVTCNVGTATVYATLHPLWSNSTGVWNLGTGRIIKNGSGDLSTIEGTFTFSNLVVNGGSFSTSLNDAGFGAKPNAFNPSNIVLNGGSIHYRHAWTMTANRGIYLGSNGGELQDQASGDALTIPGAISGPGTLYIGLGTLTCALTLSGANTYTGGTMITNGTVVFIGTNNASGTLGTGNVTNNSSLFINRTDSAFTYGGVLSGTGTLTQMGSGTTTLTGNNTYSGATAITNGTLLVNNTAGSGTGTGSVTVSGKGSLGGTGAIAGSVAVNSGGTLALGGGTLALNGGLTLASGSTVSVQVNKALSQTSGMAAVTGTLINTGADTLVVTNLGPALLAGDTFQIFSSALSGGNTMAVTGGVGVTWSNNLAGNGTITVLRAPALPQPVINQVSLSGGNIIMSGTNGSTGINYCVLTSTNISLSSSNWIAIATNTFGGNAFSITNAMSSGAQQQFYILQLP
jgi:fibronectin-binding autotransporter adhesin